MPKYNAGDVIQYKDAKKFENGMQYALIEMIAKPCKGSSFYILSSGEEVATEYLEACTYLVDSKSMAGYESRVAYNFKKDMPSKPKDLAPKLVKVNALIAVLSKDETLLKTIQVTEHECAETLAKTITEETGKTCEIFYHTKTVKVEPRKVSVTPA